MDYKPFDVKKFTKSFNYAVSGVISLLRTEQNARVHAVAVIFVGTMAYILEIPRTEAAILFMAVIMVFAVEIINTAIEKVFDLCHPESHEIIRYVKDAMAGAVLISAIIAFVVAMLIFLPHIKLLFI